MNVLSLFDGISCGQIALDQLDFNVDNYYAAEIDKWAIQVAKKNYPNTKHLGDVTELKGDDLPKIDLLIGGSPCQGFSFAGKQLNFDDPRSALFFEFVRLLKETNPKYFLLENVRMKQEYQDVISEHLGVKPIMINSALMSAQNRVRLYWTNIPNIEQPEDKGIVLKDILEDGVGDRPCELKEFNKDSTCHHAATATDIKGNESIKRVYADSGKSPTVTTMGGGHREPKVLCGRIVGRKINPETGRRDDYNPDIKAVQRLEPRLDEKSGTLTTVQKDNVVVIPPTYRKLTPLECERLQTVPDDYTEGVSNTQRYKMLGNGWTVDVIKHIFKGMK
jgi:DNA (cytosine-5)-methyltransferase 3A